MLYITAPKVCLLLFFFFFVYPKSWWAPVTKAPVLFYSGCRLRLMQTTSSGRGTLKLRETDFSPPPIFVLYSSGPFFVSFYMELAVLCQQRNMNSSTSIIIMGWDLDGDVCKCPCWSIQRIIRNWNYYLPSVLMFNSSYSRLVEAMIFESLRIIYICIWRMSASASDCFWNLMGYKRFMVQISSTGNKLIKLA